LFLGLRNERFAIASRVVQVKIRQRARSARSTRRITSRVFPRNLLRRFCVGEEAIGGVAMLLFLQETGG
jgi:hypothetical protein